jgi:hypothetical protein
MPESPGNTDAATVRSDTRRWIPWVIVPLIFIIYALHPTKKYYFDGVVFAANIEHGNIAGLFNPHHLLYTWIFYIIHNLMVAALGFDVQAVDVMLWSNVILGAIGVGLFWTLLSRMIEDDGLALLMTLLAAFSFTWWHYSTDADVYILTTVLLLLAAIRLEWIIRHRAPRNGDFVYIGLLHAASVLTHQLNIFWIVCVAGCLIWGVVPGTRSDRLRWWWIYFLSMGIPVAACYFGIGIVLLGHATPGTFWYWITEYGHIERYWVFEPRKVIGENFNGYLKAFFHRDWLTEEILRYDLKSAWAEGRFYKGFPKVVGGHFALSFLLFCYMVAVYNMRLFAREFHKRALFAYFWLLPYVLFSLFFMPGNYYYKVFIYVPILSMFAWFALADTSREKRWLKLLLFLPVVAWSVYDEPSLGITLVLLIAAFEIFRRWKSPIFRWCMLALIVFVGLYNYVEGIRPESTLARNPEVVQAMSLQDEFLPGDVLIFQGGDDFPDGWIIMALTSAKTLTLEELYKMPQEERREEFNKVFESGGRIFVHPNITERTVELGKAARELGRTEEELLRMLLEYRWVDGFTKSGRRYIELLQKGS